jgi:hypothetical protein
MLKRYSGFVVALGAMMSAAIPAARANWFSPQEPGVVEFGVPQQFPEPSAFALVALGGLGMAMLEPRWRRAA